MKTMTSSLLFFKCCCLSSLVVSVVHAFQSSTSSSFVGGPSSSSSSSRFLFAKMHKSAFMTMDLERADVTYTTARLHLDQLLIQETARTSSSSPSHRLHLTVDEAQAQYGMPWKESIDPKYHNNNNNKDEELLYMPFWKWQMDFMQENLTNLQVVSCSNDKTDFGYKENTQKKARIVSLCMRSNEYRKIRMTYYDAGDNTQVYNAVFYPDPKYNLPVLGVDILAFNRKKYLAIVDFQPLHDSETQHASTYEHLLQPIKESYPNLKGRMSSKFYDETKFFSQQMLFSRFEDESIIDQELFPAFTQYVATHLQLIRDTQPDYQNAAAVLERQRAYDVYSAERDPATGLFTAMFGAEWAQGFVHDFLFSLSSTSTPSSPSSSSVSSQEQPPVLHPPTAAVSSSTSSTAPLPPAPKAFMPRP